MSISANIKSIKTKIPENVTLVAVSKTKSYNEILEAYHAGQRVFGENKIQEMTQKWSELPKDIEWHMIGHVQRNKVKYMAAYVALIHGVDSLKLLKEINKQAKKVQRVVPCLLQIHIAEEETKFGFDREELKALIDSRVLQELEHVQIKGLMGMATFTENAKQIRKEFKTLGAMYRALRKELPDITELSMGMSGDYPIAIEEGSTMVRIGSSIFGARNKT
ncbi:YggS family pyridoxal phosphate-dependent enzyme [uncultured Muriicola sp.]|uniref:YggS family pyridoxal phosphate-dependent enzyme n=1 Tax=uncultured Muriicola sp. TaxID=1583102 RepID=UPI002623D356|nr:YggS family pyridoxal phosphate-dependent enzyme [uncultured Muriicola sp.]